MDTIRFNTLGFEVQVKQGFMLLMVIYAVMLLADRAPAWTIPAWCLVVFISILIHELGHALMARRLRLRVFDVVLWQLGGYVTHSSTTPRRQLQVSLAGPFAGFALGIPAWIVETQVAMGPEIGWVVRQLVWVNIGWGVVNLLPLLPLDGGNATRALLEMNGTSTWRAERLTTRISIGTGVILGLAGFFYFNDQFILFFGLILAMYNLQAARQPSR